jgi:anti-sigma regulatory factor (Ser/Thr protein kinase)
VSPVVVELAAQPTAARTARSAVREALDQWGLDVLVDDAVLLTSEMVTNAVLHARSATVLTLTLVADDAVRLEVADASGVLPRPHHYAATSTTGRGLRLLESLARDWGTETTPTGKRVWALLDVAHAAEPFGAGPPERR